MTSAEPLAYGPLHMTPDGLWASTPAELAALTRGYEWRDERDRTLAAWVSANLMNVWIAKGQRITIDQLLGKAAVQTTEDKAAAFTILWDKHRKAKEGGVVA